MDREISIQNYLKKAWELRRKEKYGASRIVLEKARDLCEVEDYNNLARISHIEMQYEADHNNFERAMVLCKKATALYEKADNPGKIAHSIRHLADLQVEVNLLKDAVLNYREAISIYGKHGASNTAEMANALRGYAKVLELQNKIPGALNLWEKIKHIYSAYGFKEGIKEADLKISNLLKM